MACRGKECQGEGSTGWSEILLWGEDIWAESVKEEKALDMGRAKEMKTRKREELCPETLLTCSQKTDKHWPSFLLALISSPPHVSCLQVQNFFEMYLYHISFETSCVRKCLGISPNQKQKKKKERLGIKRDCPKLISNSDKFCKKYSVKSVLITPLYVDGTTASI